MIVILSNFLALKWCEVHAAHIGLKMSAYQLKEGNLILRHAVYTVFVEKINSN